MEESPTGSWKKENGVASEGKKPKDVALTENPVLMVEKLMSRCFVEGTRARKVRDL